ncbi:protein strawberry notch homolog 1-like, partial [Temnothorax curvispinosus]|uniref:Protein strawberry notch homolog 1-like n=1 Tax=Temnothorax curvispinosus TaxID=300111 RepID=A0A6J1QCU1_9HYME
KNYFACSQNYIYYILCLCLLCLDSWDRRKKKAKKHKKPAKKRLSTLDKIQSMLVHKQSSNKNKRNGDTAISGPMSAMGGGVPHNQAPPRDSIERACSMKEELLSEIEILGERLPPNTLDQLMIVVKFYKDGALEVLKKLEIWQQCLALTISAIVIWCGSYIYHYHCKLRITHDTIT